MHPTLSEINPRMCHTRWHKLCDSKLNESDSKYPEIRNLPQEMVNENKQYLGGAHAADVIYVSKYSINSGSVGLTWDNKR